MKHVQKRKSADAARGEQHRVETEISQERAMATSNAHVLLDELQWSPFRAQAIRAILQLACLQVATSDPESSLFSLDTRVDPDVLASLDQISMKRGRRRIRPNQQQKLEHNQREGSRGRGRAGTAKAYHKTEQQELFGRTPELPRYDASPDESAR